jgi:hypothetical protein
MKTNSYIYLCFLACSFLFSSNASFAGALDELSPTDQEKVKNEQQVSIFHDIAGEAWPDATIYQYIKATPEEAAAIFFDYERHCTFFPDCQSVKILGKLAKTVAEVKYSIALPWPLGAEVYTVFDTLKAYDGGTSYRVDWKLKEATANTKDCFGNIRFEPMGTGTLMVYHNFTSPNHSGASWFVGQAKEKIKTVVSAIATQISKEAASDRGLLDQQLQGLRTALSPDL